MDTVKTMSIKRPALRYFGGKFRLMQEFILQHMPNPDSYDCYVSGFGGAANDILQVPLAKFMVYNDLDGDVVNFFDVLRNQAEQLISAIEMTPYARDEYRRAWEPLDDGLNKLEKARRYYVRSWQAFGGNRPGCATGWRFDVRAKSRYHSADTFSMTDHLWPIVERLKHIQIENDDIMVILDRYDDLRTFFYLDPPYLPDTRSARHSRGAYAHEMDYEQHRLLLERINSLAGMCIISGYPSDLYVEMLAGWKFESKHSRTVNSSGPKKTECIWINPAAADSQVQKSMF